MIIDCHGHYTTAPKALENWRNAQIAGIKDPAAMPKVADLKISDDELRETIEANQLKLMQQRGSDLTIFSPRASFMAHHIGDFNVSATWSAICNELCFRVAELFPNRFIPAAMLPQSPGVDPATCIPELIKCVEQFGNVAINLNPDPSGGHWTSPPLSDRSWYPIYEKMVEYDIPAMIHVSIEVVRACGVEAGIATGADVNHGRDAVLDHLFVNRVPAAVAQRWRCPMPATRVRVQVDGHVAELLNAFS